MAAADRVHEIIAPLVEAAGLDLYDLELAGGVLRVLVDREGGADIDAISKLTRATSRALDEHAPIAGGYTHEVRSEERRVGQEGVRTWKSRWASGHRTKIQKKT